MTGRKEYYGITALVLIIILMISLNCQVVTITKNERSGVTNRIENENYKGRKFKSEKYSWIDDTTGYEITQWTSSGNNYHPYFTVNSFISENEVLMFSDRTGSKQLFRLDLKTGDMLQMTELDGLKNIEHLPAHKKVWLLAQNVLYELNTSTLELNSIYDFSGKYEIISFTVTCDAKWFVFSTNNSIGRKNDGGYGPFTIFKLNLDDKSLLPITPDLGFNISHLQANPTDPNIILYCWQWDSPGRPRLVGESPLRIWWVNIQGTNGGPLNQAFGLHRTHESWTPDGKFVTYSGDFRFGPEKGREILGIQSIDGTTDIMYAASVWHAHQNMFRDNVHWTADLYNHDERYLMLFERDEKEIVNTTKLFKHQSSWSGRSSHPHARFSPDGKYILFTTDKSGSPQVYTVRINLDINQIKDN